MFTPRVLPSLREMLAWDESSFSQRMQGSPMRRLMLRRFQRNLCVVLGNVGTSADLPALEVVSSGGDEMVAEHANWAIERIKGRDQSIELPHDSEEEQGFQGDYT